MSTMSSGPKETPISSKRKLASQSTMRSHRSNRRSSPCSTPSMAAALLRKREQRDANPATTSLTRITMENVMKLAHIVLITSIAIAAPAMSHAQIAGSTLLGASYGELRELTQGWSAKRQILGQAVYNDLD